MPGELPGASRELVGTILETQRRCMQNLKHPGHVPEPIQVPSRDPEIDKKRTCVQKDCLGEPHRKRLSTILKASAVLDRLLL